MDKLEQGCDFELPSVFARESSRQRLFGLHICCSSLGFGWVWCASGFDQSCGLERWGMDACRTGATVWTLDRQTGLEDERGWKGWLVWEERDWIESLRQRLNSYGIFLHVWGWMFLSNISQNIPGRCAWSPWMAPSSTTQWRARTEILLWDQVLPLTATERTRESSR